MPLDVVEFKKRFGKKALDQVTPEQRYQACLGRIKPKLDAARRDQTPPIDIVDREIAAAIAKKQWSLAADLLEDSANKFNIDQGVANTLRRELKQQADRAQLGSALTPTLIAPHDAIVADIKADRYDDAREKLDAFAKAADAFANDLNGLTTRLQALEKKERSVDFKLRNQSDTGPARAAAFHNDLVLAKQDLEKHRIALAGPKLDALEQIVRTAEPADQSSDGLKAAFETARKSTVFQSALSLAGSTDTVFQGLGQTATKVVTALGLADAEAKKGNYARALEIISTFGGVASEIKQRLLEISQSVRVNGTVRMAVDEAISKGTVPATIPASDCTTLTAEVQKCKTAQTTNNLTVLIRQQVLLKPLYQKIMDAIDPAAVGVGDPLTSPKAAEYKTLIETQDLKKLAAALNAPDADLAAFRQMDGATKLLDDMVAGLGGKANTDDKRQFVRGAMKARFNLTEVTGGDDGKGLSTKALPRMYSLFAMLPPEHTTNNDMIMSVERQKANDTSWHDGRRKIVLKAGKASGKDATKTGGFDDTTLHEIAHGVDMKFGFMKAYGGGAKYGGWRDETFESVRSVALDELGMRHDFPDVAPLLLTKYLDLVFGGANPASLQQQFAAAQTDQAALEAEFKVHKAVMAADAERAAAAFDGDVQRDLSTKCKKMIKEKEPKRSMLTMVVEAVAYNKTVDEAITAVMTKLATTGTLPGAKDWAAMAVHPAVDFASSIRLRNGSAGLWDDGDSGAARCAVGGRVYQEAYAGNWVSYLHGARATRLVNYQFRHKMEWFAECYSAFFRGKLPSSHPLTVWLQQQKDDAAPAK